MISSSSHNAFFIVIQESWADVEVYSIDEAFIDLSSLPESNQNSFCIQLQKHLDGLIPEGDVVLVAF